MTPPKEKHSATVMGRPEPWTLERFIKLANAAPKPVTLPLQLLGRRRWNVPEDARRWRVLFTRIARAVASGDKNPIAIEQPSSATHFLWIGPDGRIRVFATQPQGVLYGDLRAALDGADASRVRECPVCGRIYVGRKNKKVCSDHCRQKKWKKLNPDRWDDIQTRHDAKRAEKERAEKHTKQKGGST